ADGGREQLQSGLLARALAPPHAVDGLHPLPAHPGRGSRGRHLQRSEGARPRRPRRAGARPPRRPRALGRGASRRAVVLDRRQSLPRGREVALMELYRFTPGEAPIIVSAPHPGTYIPEKIAKRLTPAALATPDTDWHIDR